MSWMVKAPTLSAGSTSRIHERRNGDEIVRLATADSSPAGCCGCEIASEFPVCLASLSPLALFVGGGLIGRESEARSPSFPWCLFGGGTMLAARRRPHGNISDFARLMPDSVRPEHGWLRAMNSVRLTRRCLRPTNSVSSRRRRLHVTQDVRRVDISTCDELSASRAQISGQSRASEA